jgi:hypothetical protein
MLIQVFLIIPLLLFTVPWRIMIVYLKCILNKTYLLLQRDSVKFLIKLSNLLFFIVFGLGILTLTTLLDTIRFVKIVLTEEEKLVFRYEKENVNIDNEFMHEVI